MDFIPVSTAILIPFPNKEFVPYLLFGLLVVVGAIAGGYGGPFLVDWLHLDRKYSRIALALGVLLGGALLGYIASLLYDRFPRIDSFAIYWYGILIVTGALLAAYIASLEAKRRGIDQDHVWNGLLVVLITGVIGARIYHIISSPNTGPDAGLQHYLNNPIDMLNFRAGGLGIFGAVAGGILGLYFFTRYAKLNFVVFVDMAMLGLPFGQAIGRWGNFFNRELYGTPTTLPWGIPIDEPNRLPQFPITTFPVETTRFHPTFLYESLANFVVGCIIIYAAKRWSKSLKSGDLFLMWGLLYGLVRFFVEMQRPDAWLISGIATAQLIGLGLMVVCGVTLMYRHTGPSKAARVQATARRRQQR